MAKASSDVAAARGEDHINGASFFRDAWSQHIYPSVKIQYEAIKLMPALRMKAKHEKLMEKKNNTEHRADADIIQDKLVAVMEEVRVKGERRNVYVILAWKGPVDNTQLQTNLTYEKVANLTLDMFCNTASKAVSAEVSSTVASAKGDETENQPRANLLHAMARQGARPWNIKNAVERGFEIPICITDTAAVPELGIFERLGMDCVVKALWLAYYWATVECSNDAAPAMKNLILDWPMDFVFINGSTPDEVNENIFKWSVNLSAKVERLRDFVGLEANNMMRIVAAAADMVQSKLVHTKRANVAFVQTWLVENVR